MPYDLIIRNGILVDGSGSPRSLTGPFGYVHDWEVGDMVLWDNWRTMHTAPPGQERVVHRTTIKGAHQTGRLL